MKCVRYSKRIYLYHELDKDERQKVDLHLQSCPHCQHLFIQVQKEHGIVKDVFAASPEMDSSKALTAKIMASINVKDIPKVYAIDRVLEFLQLNPVRYAMAILSILLIGFYIIESDIISSTNQREMYSNNTPSVKDVKLDSDLLSEYFRLTYPRSGSFFQPRKISLYECIRICRTNDHESCNECKSKVSNMYGI